MNNNLKIDVVLGLQYGDEGKGKVANTLLTKKKYTHVLRFNGGANAGHTIYKNGKKYVTHLIPCGVFYGIKSIVGNGCVVDVDKFFKEISYLKENGIDTNNLIYIAKNAHIIQKSHLHEDGRDINIGTTKTGNGPAYRDKYNRNGLRAFEVKELQPYLIDMYEEFHINNIDAFILAEGAQAFGLDIDWGDYPYVTSSHCGIGSLLLNGFSHKNINDVYGIIKAYETYVGAKKFQPSDEIFSKIQELGKEYGATTGRKRQCNWLDWDLVGKAIKMNGVNKIIINKIDILEQLNLWNIKHNNNTINFNSKTEFCSWITNKTNNDNIKIGFSDNPYDIGSFV